MIIQGEKNNLQQTEDWYKSRLGRFSCSQLYRLMVEPKLKAEKEAGNLSDGAKTYVTESVAERITGQRAKDDFSSKYTEWGNDNEPIAVKIYEHLNKCTVSNSKYIPYGENFGGSPDGLIGDNGIVEIKCPYTITAHLNHIFISDFRSEVKEYYWQCIGYLLVTGREWLDFISYHPNYPGKYQYKKIRMYAKNHEDDINLAISKIKKATEHFNLLLNKIENG